MLIYKKLRWGDAFSYGDNNELVLDSAPLTQIVAKNGNGKSSIAAILEEVQFNKNSKGVKKSDILNRYTTRPFYWIELTFSKDDDLYVIYTKRGSTQSVTLHKNGEDISAHTATNTYKLIEEILGYDHKTFAQIVYQSNASSLGFLTATDSTRKKFLIDLFKTLEKYTEYGELYKSLVKDINVDVGKHKAELGVINSWLAKLDKEDLVERATVEVPSPPDDLIKQKTELELKLSGITKQNQIIVQNNKYADILSGLDISPCIENIIPTDELSEGIAVLKSEIATAEKHIREHSTKARTKNCPTCGQPVDNSQSEAIVATQQLKVAQSKRVLEELTTKLATATANNTIVKATEARIAEWEKYHNLYDPTIPKEVLVGEVLIKEIADLEGQIKKRNAAILAANKINMEASAHNSRIKVVLSQKEGMLADKAKANLALQEAERILDVRQTLAKVFSSTGLLAYKIECLVKDLEDITNQYLLQLSDGRFQLGFQISSTDKLNVIITDNCIDIDITALSSGELARVNAATLLGIRKLMQTISNTKTNLLILDETIDNLDIDGKDKLIEILLKENELNTFIVSHGYTHPLLEQLSVVKENNFSRIG